MRAKINNKVFLTRGCEKCAAFQICDRRAIIRLERDSPAIVQESICNGCGLCIKACPAVILDEKK